VSAEAIPLAKDEELPIEGLGVTSDSIPSRAATRIAPLGFVVLVPPLRGDRLIERCKL
jgi:hypothetical protein